MIKSLNILFDFTKEIVAVFFVGMREQSSDLDIYILYVFLALCTQQASWVHYPKEKEKLT